MSTDTDTTVSSGDHTPTGRAGRVPAVVAAGGGPPATCPACGGLYEWADSRARVRCRSCRREEWADRAINGCPGGGR